VQVPELHVLHAFFHFLSSSESTPFPQDAFEMPIYNYYINTSILNQVFTF